MALHPEGRFKAVIEDHGYMPTKDGSGMQFFAKFNTNDGKVITGFFALSGGAAEHTLKRIRAMGYNGDDMNELTEGNVLIGNECEIEVKHETWQGKERAKVVWVDPKGGAQVKRLEAGANIAKFNALLKKTPIVTGDPVEEPFH